MAENKKYTLVGVDGNAYSIMGYTRRALMETGHRDLIEAMVNAATSSDYYHLLAVCDDYIDVANGDKKPEDLTSADER